MKIARKHLAPISLLLVSTIGVAYAANTLFTQTFPAIPATPALTSNCTTLTPNTSSVATGSSGFIGFDCSGTSAFGTTPAITSPSAITATPQFTLPSGYMALGVFTPGTNNCIGPSANSFPILTSGTSIGINGSLDYCRSTLTLQVPAWQPLT